MGAQVDELEGGVGNGSSGEVTDSPAGVGGFWSAEGEWRSTFGLLVVVVAAGFVFAQLRPDLLFKDTTPNGGDTGAHVWWPAYLRDHVIGKFRLSGWAPDWYGGFPVGHFYFPLPALGVIALDLLLPYNVAFKLVTVSGVVALPAAAYYFARGIKAPWPAPPLFAAATLPFLFLPKYQHFGGNMVSQLQGEFSFSIALALGLAFLGAWARALDERRRLALPAVLFAATVMSHLIVTVFVVGGAVVIWLERRSRQNFPIAAAIGGVGALLTAVWTLPMVARLAYTTDMGWVKEPASRLTGRVNPPYGYDYRWVIALAALGSVVGVVSGRRSTLRMFGIALLFGSAFWLLPETRLWNGRILSFWFLSVSLLAALGVAELINLAIRFSAMPNDRAEWRAWTGAGLAALALVGAMMWSHNSRSFLPHWVAWNTSGYETKAAYPEYRNILEVARGLPPGRVLWERLNAINNYGSDFALMLLPYFTDGRIGSMEGVYFESSASTPYHFLTVSELAKEPSNPVRGLPYGHMSTDFAQGVKHMQLLGVRYFMAGSKEAIAAADANADLKLVRNIKTPMLLPQVANWHIYEVSGSQLVEGLDYQPVVLDGVSPGDWLDPASKWFRDPSAIDRPLVSGGPSSWKRSGQQSASTTAKKSLPPVRVSRIRSDDDSISFRVDRVGVPVLVKTSYFPNWQARGADGPWRATPNLMVVVPTSRDVTLHYGRTPVDLLGIGLSLAGLVGVVALSRWRPRPLVPAPDSSGEVSQG